jgi:hypothetical protein
MSNDDVWAGTEAAAAKAIGGPVGEGLPMNMAFSVDMVFRNGLAVLKEQPGFAFAGGFIQFLCAFAPAFASMPFTFYAITLQPGSAEAEVMNLVGSAVQLGLALIALPIQQVFLAGLIIGLARWASDGALEWRALWSNLLPAVRMFLYQLLMVLIGLVLGIVVALPLAAVVGGGIALELPGALIAVLALIIGVLGLGGAIYVSLGLQNGIMISLLDDAWPIEALTRSWQAAEGARLTLFVTNLVFGVAMIVASFSVYCLVGVALYPLVFALYFAGQAVSWLLHARSDDVTRKWAFFERNPIPVI